jgi:hypothetical protein
MHHIRQNVEIHPTIFKHCVGLQEHAVNNLRNSLDLIDSNPVQAKENIIGVLSILGATTVVFEDTQYRYENKQLEE